MRDQGVWGHPDQWVGADARAELRGLRAEIARKDEALRVAQAWLYGSGLETGGSEAWGQVRNTIRAALAPAPIAHEGGEG